MSLDLVSILNQYCNPAPINITGSKGSYDKSTSIGKSANAGNELGTILSGSSAWKAKNSNITYSTMDGAAEGSTGVKLVNINNALAFSTEALIGFDKDEDDSVTVAEFNKGIAAKNSSPFASSIDSSSLKFGETVDLNSDGKIDAGEYSAWTVYQDGMNKTNNDDSYNADAAQYLRDGKVTASESKQAESLVTADSDTVKTELQAIYDSNKIAEVKEDFEMPDKVESTSSNNMMQILMMLIQMMFGGSTSSSNSNQFSASSLLSLLGLSA